MTEIHENWEITDNILLSSRKGGNLYRRYRRIRKMEDNHLCNPPPENQVGDLLESCKVDNFQTTQAA